MPTYRVTSPDGRVFDVTPPEGTNPTEAEILAQTQAQAGAGAPPETPATPSSPSFADRALSAVAAPFRGLSVAADKLTSPLVDVARLANGEPVSNLITTPSSEVRSPRGNPLVTQGLRIAPSFAPGMPLASGLSGAGEMIAQKVEAPNEPINPLPVAAAIAVPPVVAGAVRGVRALGRTATRVFSGRFEKAQETAANAAGDVATTLAPEEGAAARLFASAKGAQETVPAGRITAILDDLETSLPKTPADTGLQQVRTAMDNIRGTIKNGTIDLDELLRQRLDLGRLISRGGSAPELKAIYGHGGDNAKGIIGALEEAAAAGGTGAAATREALDLFKRDLGVVKWRDLVETATKVNTVNGSQTPILNMAKLGNLVAKNADDLERTLGPEGLTLIRAFQEKFRALPPTQAHNAANLLVSGVLGGVGGYVTGGMGLSVAGGAAAGFVTKELIQNWKIVGNNPAAANQIMTGLAQATRSTVMPMVATPTPVRVGRGAQEAAGAR